MGIHSAYTNYRNRQLRWALAGFVGTLLFVSGAYGAYALIPILFPERQFSLNELRGTKQSEQQKDPMPGRLDGHTVTYRVDYLSTNKGALPISITGQADPEAVLSFLEQAVDASRFLPVCTDGTTFVLLPDGIARFSKGGFNFYRDLPEFPVTD